MPQVKLRRVKKNVNYFLFSLEKVMSLGTLVGALGPDIDRMIAKVFGTLSFKVRSSNLITLTSSHRPGEVLLIKQ